MSITRADIVSNVRDLMDDDQLDATLITNAANWFVDELANNNQLRMFEDSDTLTALQAATTLAFPTTMATMISLYTTVPQVYDLTHYYVPYGDFIRRYADFATATQTGAYQWTDFGNGVRFAAPLNAAHTFQCDFIRFPVKMAIDADVCEIPDNYEEMVFIGTKVRIMDINEDYAEANQERTIKLDPLVATFKKNESRGQIKTGPNVMRTNRRRGGNKLGDPYEGF